MTKKLSLLVTVLTLLALPLNMALAQENVEIPEEIANMQSEGFTIVPTNPDTPGSSNFNFELGPGSEVRDSVTIANLSNDPATFYLYGADPTLSQQGTKAYKTRADGGTGEGQWIVFDEPEILLQGGEKRQAQFTLSVPSDTSFGDYRAGIAMEKTKKDINNPNVTIATRLVLHTNMNIRNIPPTKTNEDGVSATWQAYYFWISLTLFLVSLAALIWITFEESKETTKPKRSSTKKTSARKSTRKTATRKTTTRKSTKKKK